VGVGDRWTLAALIELPYCGRLEAVRVRGHGDEMDGPWGRWV
jgi:hypothetical protein